MSLPADITIDRDTPPVRGNDLVAQINNLIDENRTLRTGLADTAAALNLLQTAVDTMATKLNADAGVTDTNYAATNATHAVTTTAFATDTTHKAHKLKH